MFLDGLIPAPSWLNSGDTGWQLTAATLVGIQSVPGLAILYAGLMKRKWSLNSGLMVLYAFAITLLVWTLWSYNMSFGSSAKIAGQDVIGIPWPVNFASSELSQATIPLLTNAGLLPPLRFPTSAMVYFQFVFAAITVIILGGALLGRMNFKAWMLFVPLWMTLVYPVGAFLIWGGGWLAQQGAVPDDASIVVVSGPRNDFFPPEIDALKKYLAKGGKLLMELDPPDKADSPPLTNLIALAHDFGLVVFVIDLTDNFFNQILDRDQSCHPAVLVNHDCHADIVLLHLA